MSGLWISLDGNLIHYEATFFICRWSPGAEHGKTHVVSSRSFSRHGMRDSWQCVTDDFGNLVAVA
jgi:hypothetical protein